MPSVILVTDPILRVRTVSGTARVGLHELLHLAHTEALIDLSGVRADQRAPVVTALAIISHLVMRYSPSVKATADDWRDAFVTQFGDCLTLVGGPDDKPQFLQPVIDMMLAEPFTVTEMDHLMPAMRHALKAVNEASPEEGLYALMSSTWRHHGGLGHHAGARARLLTALVGDGLTIGSEIVSLSTAYAAMRPRIVGSDAFPARLLDHMLWAQPWVDARPLATVPYPFIDCRRIRLVAAHAGLVRAVVVSSTASRVDTATGVFEKTLQKLGIVPGRLRISLELPSNEAVREAVEAGMGATAISASVAAASIENGLLCHVPLNLPQREFHVLHHRERHRSRVAEALLASLDRPGKPKHAGQSRSAKPSRKSAQNG